MVLSWYAAKSGVSRVEYYKLHALLTIDHTMGMLKMCALVSD